VKWRRSAPARAGDGGEQHERLGLEAQQGHGRRPAPPRVTRGWHQAPAVGRAVDAADHEEHDGQWHDITIRKRRREGRTSALTRAGMPEMAVLCRGSARTRWQPQAAPLRATTAQDGEIVLAQPVVGVTTSHAHDRAPARQPAHADGACQCRRQQGAKA